MTDLKKAQTRIAQPRDAPRKEKNRSGYKSFSSLEAGKDYKVWPLSPELNRVPGCRPEVSAGQEA